MQGEGLIARILINFQLVRIGTEEQKAEAIKDLEYIAKRKEAQEWRKAKMLPSDGEKSSGQGDRTSVKGNSGKCSPIEQSDIEQNDSNRKSS
jgi:hypothetical protein